MWPGIVLEAVATEMTDVWFQYSGSLQSGRAVVGKEDGKKYMSYRRRQVLPGFHHSDSLPSR